jgi:hypothetical protein
MPLVAKRIVVVGDDAVQAGTLRGWLADVGHAVCGLAARAGEAVDLGWLAKPARRGRFERRWRRWRSLPGWCACGPCTCTRSPRPVPVPSAGRKLFPYSVRSFQASASSSVVSS